MSAMGEQIAKTMEMRSVVVSKSKAMRVTSSGKHELNLVKYIPGNTYVPPHCGVKANSLYRCILIQ